jgi:hypothetical protein
VALTQQLKSLFKQGDAQLKSSMDKLMLNFKSTDKEFFDTYTSAREIMDAATSSTNITGTVTDSKTSKPVRGVSIAVDGKPYSAISNSKGKYILKIPVPGVYTIKFIKEGYQDKMEKGIEVAIGKSTTLNVTMDV